MSSSVALVRFRQVGLLVLPLCSPVPLFSQSLRSTVWGPTHVSNGLVMQASEKTKLFRLAPDVISPPCRPHLLLPLVGGADGGGSGQSSARRGVSLAWLLSLADCCRDSGLPKDTSTGHVVSF